MSWPRHHCWLLSGRLPLLPIIQRQLSRVVFEHKSFGLHFSAGRTSDWRRCLDYGTLWTTNCDRPGISSCSPKCRQHCSGVPGAEQLRGLQEDDPSVSRQLLQRTFQAEDMFENTPGTRCLYDCNLERAATGRFKLLEHQPHLLVDFSRGRRGPAHEDTGQWLRLRAQGLQTNCKLVGVHGILDMCSDHRRETCFSLGLHLGLWLWRASCTCQLVAFPMLCLMLSSTIPHPLATPAFGDRLLCADGTQMGHCTDGRQLLLTQVELNLQDEALLRAPVRIVVADVIVARLLHKQQLFLLRRRTCCRMQALAALVWNQLVS
mmetsp:Transcript_65691/g.116586  ORF Transcript_65691/g.116586 Transcript_65691/m.116586 type:complete len:319 (-) Transcript_65691:236-1192(-)